MTVGVRSCSVSKTVLRIVGVQDREVSKTVAIALGVQDRAQNCGCPRPWVSKTVELWVSKTVALCGTGRAAVRDP